MKRVFTAFSAFIIGMCAVCAANAEINFVPQAGIDIPSSIVYDSLPDEDTKRGFNLSAEIRGDISKYFMLGAGVRYMFDRGTAGAGLGGSLSFLPVYGSLFFTPFGYFYQVKPYVRLNVGYDVLASNNAAEETEGGIAWSGGVGVEYKNVVGEVYGAHHYGIADSADFKYVQICISLGYKFKLKS
jgi:hypothetical protein